jgi:hypothetical protein
VIEATVSPEQMEISAQAKNHTELIYNATNNTQNFVVI